MNDHWHLTPVPRTRGDEPGCVIVVKLPPVPRTRGDELANGPFPARAGMNRYEVESAPRFGTAARSPHARDDEPTRSTIPFPARVGDQPPKRS